MKKTISILLLMIVFISCGNKNNSKWTEQDKKNAYNNCMFGKLPELTEEQMKKRCECFLEKVMELSPDPAKQSELSTEAVRKLNDECTAEAKK